MNGERNNATEAVAWGFLILFGLAVARNARAGTLGAWAAAKFVNRGAIVGELPAPGAATAAALGLAPSPGGPLPSGGGGRLTDPLPGGSTGDRFGVPRAGGTRTHQGIDLIATAGTPIRAAEAGRLSTYTLSLCGIGATVTHAGGIRTHYCHMTHYAVRSGTTVTRGQIIGYVGSTGNSDGPHLHFEVEVNGSKVDPAPWIGR